jgi:hypothetical protein
MMTHHLAEAYSKIALLQNGGHQKTGSPRKDVAMDRYPDRQYLLRMLPGNLRERPLDKAEDRTNGIPTLDQCVVGRGDS